MNILQFSKFYPPVHGGIETVTLELTEGLNARGHRTDVLCANIGPSTRVDAMPGYEIERAGAWGRLLSTSVSPALVRLWRRARDRHDIVHIHLPNPMANLALRLAPTRARVVLHWHSDIVNQPWALRLYAPMQDALLERADAVIATSAAYAQHSRPLQRHLHKVRIVPLGLAPDRLAEDPRAVATRAATIRRHHGERPIVFALGRMAAYKGFGTLIDAAGRLRHDAQILVGGAGERLELHRDHVRSAGLQHRVRFLGALSALDVAAHMAAANVFCLPSRSRAEAFGMVLLEAMAAALPIVASDIPGSGVSWVNEEGVTGFNVPVSDAGALAAAIDRLLAEPAAARAMGEAGRRRLDTVFSVDQMVDGTLAVYDEIRSGSLRPA